MARLLLLFILVPAIELMLLIKLGAIIGLLPTVGIIVFTGFLGAALTRWQGLAVLRRMQQELAAGQMPAGAIMDGVIILMAGALLLTPGFLTDLVGFACLVPGVRSVIKRVVRARVERAIRDGRGVMFVQMGGIGGAPWRRPPSDLEGKDRIEM